MGNLMRVSVVAAAMCGLFLFLFVIPSLGESIIYENPEVGGWFWPWLAFAWLFALPCVAILVLVWKVSGAVIHDAVFTVKTAKWVKAGSILLLCDSAFLFAGNFVLDLLGMNHPSMMLMAVVGVIFGVALSLLAAVLARYLTKAAALQEESEGTL
jgi:hypothetical protein